MVESAGSQLTPSADRLAEFFARRRLRLARRAGSILVLGPAVWSIGQALYGSWLLCYLFAAVASAALAILVFLQRFRRTELATFLLSVLLTLVITVGNWFGGGLGGGNASMFLLIPVGAVALAGGRGLWWMIPTVFIVGVMGLLHQSGYVFPNEIPPEQRRLDTFLTWLTTFSVVAYLILSYEAVNRNLAGELEQARRQAEQAQQAKSRFVAQVSHEIRTPLHGLLGIIALMEEEDNPNRRLELAEQAGNTSRVLQGILGDLQDLSLVESGRLRLRPESFSPAQIAKQTIDLLLPRARQKNLELTLDISESLPPRLFGDATRLQQVLMNLLGNAIKYTQNGGVRLSIESRVASAGSVRLHFAVKDSGRGIPPEEKEKIFEPFYQVPSTQPGRQEGVGLGLPICRKLLALMGGRMHVDSEPGRGSTFYFEVEMPLAGPSAEELPADAAATEPVLPTASQVLVVEDDKNNRRLAELMLQSAGCAVVAVADGENALREAKRRDFHLVLLDIQMPGMDGFEVGRRLRQLWQESGKKAPPLVAVTAQAGESRREYFRERGMDEVIFKPFARKALLRLLARFLRERVK